jgi:cardiolipin synthase A/B
MYDWIGSYSLPAAFVRELLDAGVDVRVYHPLVWRRPSWAINRRSHRKLLIVDRRIGFTGGLNIGDDYAPADQGGKGWRDTHVCLEGSEVAMRLEAAYNYAWNIATPYDASRKPVQRVRMGLHHIGRRLKRRWRRAADGREAMLEGGGIAVKILGNEEFRFRRRIHSAYLHAINNARRYVLIENAYFIPNRSVRQALMRAAGRGATVAVVLASHSDVPITTYASRYLYRELLSAGVRIFEWQEGMMHAKTAVIDDAWSIVGSYNFDHRSLLHQLELAAMIADGGFAATLRDRTLADIARCIEVTLDQHNRRHWWQRTLEWLAYLARSLL